MDIKKIKGIDRISSRFYKGLNELINELPSYPFIKRIAVIGQMVDIDEKDIAFDDMVGVAVELIKGDYTEEEIDDFYEKVYKDYDMVAIVIAQDPTMNTNKILDAMDKGVLLYEAKTKTT